MTWEEIKGALEVPFPVNKIHWRPGSTNKDKTKCIALAYIDERDAMKRLDDVMGPYWQRRYTLSDGKLLICEVGLKIDGEWIWRANGAGDTNVEAEKGKASDAFKRACVNWGIARYLYSLPNVWVPLKDGKYLSETPDLPTWATPEGYLKLMEERKAA